MPGPYGQLCQGGTHVLPCSSIVGSTPTAECNKTHGGLSVPSWQAQNGRMVQQGSPSLPFPTPLVWEWLNVNPAYGGRGVDAVMGVVLHL